MAEKGEGLITSYLLKISYLYSNYANDCFGDYENIVCLPRKNIETGIYFFLTKSHKRLMSVVVGNI